jgi:hypothetical protein
MSTVKIVLNGCYGGFGLSEAALRRYAEIKGLNTSLERGFSYIINDDGERISCYDLERTDPALVRVVEELGDKANDGFSRLYIEELEKGTLYRINEYDGIESLETKDSIDWNVA